MSYIYNQFAGKNLDRLTALSDGVFAFAMTLLVLDLRPPNLGAVPSEAGLLGALHGILPNLGTYLMSFLTLGIFWVGQQTQLNHLERSERHLTWIHLAFLFLVTLMPFSTRLLTEFITYRTPLIAYWANIFLLGALLYLSWGRVTRAGLVKSDTPPKIVNAIFRRIWTAQAFYAFGALLCVFHPYWSIGFIVFMQLYYAIAPRYERRHRSEVA
jgi:uncharacterized membrane protein